MCSKDNNTLDTTIMAERDTRESERDREGERERERERGGGGGQTETTFINAGHKQSVEHL